MAERRGAICVEFSSEHLQVGKKNQTPNKWERRNSRTGHDRGMPNDAHCRSAVALAAAESHNATMDVVGCAAILRQFFERSQLRLDAEKRKIRRRSRRTSAGQSRRSKNLADPREDNREESTVPVLAEEKLPLKEHRTERTRELDEQAQMVGTGENCTNAPPLDVPERRAKTVHFGEFDDIIAGSGDEEQAREEEEERAEESDVEDNVEEWEDEQQREEESRRPTKRLTAPENGTSAAKEKQNNKRSHQLSEEKDLAQEAQLELERSQKSVQLLQFQIREREAQLGELAEKMAQMEQREQRDTDREKARLAEYERLLEAANAKINRLMEEDGQKQRTIEELHTKLSNALETASNVSLQKSANNENGTSLENGHSESDFENLREETRRLEQRLRDANEEKEYYKKHFKGENGAAQNGRGGGGHFNDDFGKELMLANKRKYQLESRQKQLEMELREAQQRSAHLAESVKSAEKLLWLEKERSATLECEREQMGDQIVELMRNAEALKRELEAATGDGVPAPVNQTALDAMRAEMEQRLAELRNMKNKVDWRLGEVTQSYHDTKWRLGEVESTLAHRDWELEQANNRIKQLENSVAATPSAFLNDELDRLRADLARMGDEKSKVDWRLGEVTQWWNDAKWRVGELEAETAHRSTLLDQAHLRIGELERGLTNSSNGDSVRERQQFEGRVAELEKLYNDAKWRIGELEAQLAQGGGGELNNELREQKSKLEWRLGEMTQRWNDAKWRVGELEEALRRRDSESYFGRSGELDVLRALVSDGTFLIRKQPHADRHKWKQLTIENALSGGEATLRRCWFETETDGTNEVFLIGSFVNWECALRCEPVPDRASTKGIWVDLPRGRHEFRFLRDGQWHTENIYSDCWNQHGKKNNWLNVE